MSELVEKVARAISEGDWEQAPEGRAGQRMMQNRDGTFRDINALSRDEYRDQARAAIAAVAEWIGDHEHIDKDRSVHLALVWQYTQKESK